MAVELILAALSAFALSAWLTFRFSRPGSRLYILDQPTERSLHSQPIPRSGGVAIVAAIFVVGVVLWGLRDELAGGLPWLVSAWLLVAGIGFADDQRPLSPLLRLLVHGAAGVLVIFGGYTLERLGLPGWAALLPRVLAILVTWLFVVWMINLYNFMDGLDGFAGGMTCIGFGTFALIGGFSGHALFATLSLVIAFSALGFLCFNFPPARIFMGDVGAYSLGLLAAGFTLWGVRDAVFPLWIPVLIFSPFIVDATVTLFWRTLRGEPVWKAHRTHCYQRLVQQGFGHRKTVVWQYVLMLACAGSALMALQLPEYIQWLIMLCWVAVYGMLYVGVARWCPRNAAQAEAAQ